MAKVGFGAKKPSAVPAGNKSNAPVAPVAPVEPAAIDVEQVQDGEETPAPAPAPKAAKAPKAAPAAEVPARVAPPVNRGTSLSLYSDSTEHIDLEDLVLPRLNLAQRVGDLGETYEPGTIVLGKSQAIGGPGHPVRVVFLGQLKTRYVTVVKGGMGEVVSEQEFRAANGTTNKDEAEGSDKPLFQKLVSFALFVRKPDGEDDSQFPYIYEAKGEEDAHLAGSWALAIISLKGGSYINVGKPVLSARKMGRLSKGFSTCSYELACEDKLYRTGNRAFTFTVGGVKSTNPEFRSWLCQAMSVAKDTSSEDEAAASGE